MEGEAGIGKSTLLKKMALDWANHELTEFDHVFAISLRAIEEEQVSGTGFSCDKLASKEKILVKTSTAVATLQATPLPIPCSEKQLISSQRTQIFSPSWPFQTLEEMIISQSDLLSAKGLDPSIVRGVLEKDSPRTLLLLDGLDESCSNKDVRTVFTRVSVSSEKKDTPQQIQQTALMLATQNNPSFQCVQVRADTCPALRTSD